MKIQYYDKDYDKWCLGTIKTAVVEDSGTVRSVYGDNIKCLHHNDEPGKCPVCGKDMYWEWWEMFFGGFLLLFFAAAIFCMGIYIYKSLFL